MIQRIDYNTIEGYGDVFLVFANKQEVYKQSKVKITSFRYGECEDTEVFIYPQNMSVISPIVAILESGKPWEPFFEDFERGGLRFPNGRRVAYYHDSLVPVDEIIEFIYRPFAVSSDQITWHCIRKDKKPSAKWEFTLVSIKTPYGYFEIDNYADVEQNGMAGIKMDVYGIADLSKFSRYRENKDECIFIHQIVIVKKLESFGLYIRLYHNNQLVISFTGKDDEIMAYQFYKYVNKLKKYYSVLE